MNVTIPEDCGNAPKKLFLKDLNIAFANCDSRQVLERVTEDITWQTMGQDQVIGHTQLKAKLVAAQVNPISDLALTEIITHGRAGAVYGTFTLTSGMTFAFGNFYHFNRTDNQAKVKHITSFLTEISAI